MSRPTCQCVKDGYGCDTPMTEEDLLCDPCRAGCNLFRGNGLFEPGQPITHGRIESIEINGVTLALK